MQVERAIAPRIHLTPTTRALKVAIPVQAGKYQLRVAGLEASPYATTDEGLFFDLHDNNQLSWPKAHKASIWHGDCKISDFFLIKDAPLAPTLSTTDDCKQDWQPNKCEPQMTRKPHRCDTASTCKSGCNCADLGGATCVGCLTTTTIAVHNPAY